MRRTLIVLLSLAALLALSGCGNKGPLVRPSAQAAPAAAASVPAPPPISTQPVAAPVRLPQPWPPAPTDGG